MFRLTPRHTHPKPILTDKKDLRRMNKKADIMIIGAVFGNINSVYKCIINVRRK